MISESKVDSVLSKFFKPEPEPLPKQEKQVRIVIEIPGILEATGNARLHPMALAELKASQRDAVLFKWPFALRGCLTGVEVFKVSACLTRGSAGELDDDNLRTSFKAIRDEVTRCLGLKTDKTSERLTWEYREEKTARGTGFARIEVQIETEARLLPVALAPRSSSKKKKAPKKSAKSGARYAAARPNVITPREG